MNLLEIIGITLSVIFNDIHDVMKNCILLGLALLLIVSCKENPEPQEPDPGRRKSPIAITSITHQPSDTYMKIVYGQPYKKGRDIFGGLVPYGEVWRTGANEATEMTTTNEIMFNGKRLEAGTYGFFSIPRKDQWTIILNDSLGQGGAFDYNQEFDHLRTTVKPTSTDQTAEAFTIQFTEISGDSSAIVMRWDTLRVHIPIRFLPQTSSTN